jgi:hypothetical protein
MHTDYAFGGGGGIRTPVQNLFLFASYSNINRKASENHRPYYLLQN